MYKTVAAKEPANGPRNGLAICLSHRDSSLSFRKIFWRWRRLSSDKKRPLISRFNDSNWRCCSTDFRTSGKKTLGGVWDSPDARFCVGVNAGPPGISQCTIIQDAAARPIFPPLDHATIKALACERVAETGLAISRQSLADVTSRVRQALGKPISRSSVWRILDSDAIKPWRFKYWIFPRDPAFSEKARRILDLYAGYWYGEPLRPKDYILSADEKTSIQARIRCHHSLPTSPGRAARIEFEYERGGALQYLAAWDVRRGYVMGRCEATTGMVPFERLLRQVLSQEPYLSAERLFLIVDNGSSHRGEASRERMRQLDPRIILIHTPVHASWLNQVEIYFSIIQRKVLNPNDFADLTDVETRLSLYEELTNQCPTPFNWKFNREKLAVLLQKIEVRRHFRASQFTKLNA
jgi:DDE superfamily endonuclease